MVATEFQAVVLAGGRGSRYTELTGTRPKCLLPIGPFPMIFYPLHMLQRHGFQEIIVIVLEDERLEIQQMLERTPIKAKLDFATLPYEMATAQALKHISDRYVGKGLQYESALMFLSYPKYIHLTFIFDQQHKM